ncbi:hypothetical protein V8F06_009428 [Rhypophila decipiens]
MVPAPRTHTGLGGIPLTNEEYVLEDYGNHLGIINIDWSWQGSSPAKAYKSWFRVNVFTGGVRKRMENRTLPSNQSNVLPSRLSPDTQLRLYKPQPSPSGEASESKSIVLESRLLPPAAPDMEYSCRGSFCPSPISSSQAVSVIDERGVGTQLAVCDPGLDKEPSLIQASVLGLTALVRLSALRSPLVVGMDAESDIDSWSSDVTGGDAKKEERLKPGSLDKRIGLRVLVFLSRRSSTISEADDGREVRDTVRLSGSNLLIKLRKLLYKSTI